MSIVYDFADIARRMNCGKPVKRTFKPADMKAVEVLPPDQVVVPPPIPSICQVCRNHGHMVKTTAHKHSFRCNWCGADDLRVHCSNCHKWPSIAGFSPNAKSCSCAYCYATINL
jgi:hypothetical protein